MFQGHSNIVQFRGTNNEAQVSEDSSELGAQRRYQRCSGDLEKRGKRGAQRGVEVLSWPEGCNLMTVTIV